MNSRNTTNLPFVGMKAVSALLLLSAAGWAANPAPTITSISPVSGSPAGGTVVTITGTGFFSGAKVTFGSTPSPKVVWDSRTQVRATAPASPGGAEGPVNITLTNPDTQAASLTNGFSYFLPAPTITSINPTVSSAKGGTVITITGTNFVSGAVAAFGPNNATATTFVSKTQLKATTPASSLNNNGSDEGTVSVFVTNPDQQFAKLPQGLMYHDPPTITSIAPAGGTTAGGYTVTLVGQNFRQGATVMFGTVASPSVVYNAGGASLTVTVPAQAAAGPVNVVLKDTDGLSYTLKNGFTYSSVFVSSVTPNIGPLGGANTVTIQGSGFTSTTSVTFGTTPATSVTFVSATQLTAVAPAHAAGPVALTVSNSNGSDTMTAAYTYTGKPIITSVVPSSGPLNGGTAVTISGFNLKNTNSVLFGSASATIISTATGAVKVTSPAYPGGTNPNPAPIQITTTNGTTTAAPGFSYSLSILTQGLDDGYANVAYSNTLSVTGGTPPYRWTITSGSLPNGLSLNASTGVISGTPGATYGTYTIGLQVTDSTTPANTASTTLSFNILFGFTTQVIPPNFFGMIVYDQTTASSWPTVSFGALGKGLATTWPFIQPTAPVPNQPPVYNWAVLDQYVADAQAHQIPGTNQPLTLYWTNANIPQWAAADPTTCSTYAGTTITACTSAIASSHIADFQAFMQALVTRYLGQIQIFELWNEPNVSNVYTGSFADLANMTSIAYNVIRQYNPTATVLSPSPTQAPFLNSYLTTPGAPLGVDAIAIHGYPDVNTNDVAEAIVGFKSVNIKLTMAAIPGVGAKPIWDTESSWGGQNSITDPDLRVGFVARSFLLHWSVGIHNMYWYGWDSPSWGTLYYAPPGVGATPAATAYQQTYNWMVGAYMPAPCSANGGSTYAAVYTCQLARLGTSYQGLAVWDTTQRCVNGACTTSTYIPSPIYTQYRDLTGKVTTITPGQPIQIGVKPILLENFSPAADPPPPPDATFTYSGLTPPIVSMSVTHPNVPSVTFSGNQAHTFTPAIGQIAPQNLLVAQGLSAPSIVNTDAVDSDATLAVGTTQVMQWADFGIEIYNKSGAPVAGVQAAAFWSDNSPCSAGVGADGQVQFDKINSRWVVGMRSGPNTECIAVSQGSDATLQYNEYALTYHDPLHPDYQMDYPKLAIWPDGYYIVFDMLDVPAGYIPRYAVACALQSSSMLFGSASAQAVCIPTMYNNNTGFFHLLPSDLDSAAPPPSGSPNHIFTFAKPVGSTQYHLYRYEFHVNWTTLSASTLNGPFQIDTNAFAGYLPACGAGNSNCVPQPAPALYPLDSVGGYLMGRAAYRNFGTYESVVFSQAVQTSSTSPVGVRWYELRNLSTTPAIYQSGFLQAANSSTTPDSFSRWMSAMAQDSAGNIAMGYSISGAAATSYYSGLPGLAIDARAPSTPLGTLLTEDIVFNGIGVEQPAPPLRTGRWGAVSGMAIDPVNQCTFWFTGQYEPSNGVYNWSTKLVSFSLPGCQ